jgi:hypothetical protein
MLFDQVLFYDVGLPAALEQTRPGFVRLMLAASTVVNLDVVHRLHDLAGRSTSAIEQAVEHD